MAERLADPASPQEGVEDEEGMEEEEEEEEEEEDKREEAGSVTTSSVQVQNAALRLRRSSVFSDGGFASSMSASSYDVRLAHLDGEFRRMARWTVGLWLFLSGAIYAITPKEKIQYLEGTERLAAAFAAGVLFVSTTTSLLPVILRSREGITKRRAKISGALFGALIVQFIAMSTDMFMSVMPVPVVVDFVTGCRVHLLRWAEWIPLAMYMTFLTEGASLPIDNNGLVMAYASSACQGLSASAGLLFPFMPNVLSWWCLMVLSCLLYLVIFYRLDHRSRLFRQMTPGSSVAQEELYNQARLALELLTHCATMWTLLVLLYFFVYLIAPHLGDDHSFFRHPSLSMVSESFMDVILKVLYVIVIVEMHETVFNEAARTERRLNEIRQMTSAVWESSSDVICISIRGFSGKITTLLSPQYLKMKKIRRGPERTDTTNANQATSTDLGDSGFALALALAFDLEAKRVMEHWPFVRNIPSSFTPSDSTIPNHDVHSKPTMPEHTLKVENIVLVDYFQGYTAQKQDELIASELVTHEEISSVAELIARAWRSEPIDSLFHYDLVKSNRRSGGQREKIRCEANVTFLDSQSLVVVVRDISERYRRFEAEKQAIFETTARQKDEEANRFTRHEVKNGLLSAIGLCDSLQDGFRSLPVLTTSTTTTTPPPSSMPKPSTVLSPTPSIGSLEAEIFRSVWELDKTLHEILDTILAQTMARDVIHEIYEPKMERVDITNVIFGPQTRQRLDRFPVTTQPNPLPILAFDPQLLKHIHRNAISNACKYGKKGGVVRTDIQYDNDAKILQMNVINLPGDHHAELIDMGSKAKVAVFSPRKRLHEKFNETSKAKKGMISHSSGDGAWIMLKCAKTLGGECDIKFLPDKTIFTLRCPAKPYEEFVKNVSVNPQAFRLPLNLWGIAIDDSNIQRKLLDRMLVMSGVEKSKCIILGSSPEEITGFSDFVVEFINHHPVDKFLLIVDENLDIDDCDSVSGSICIESIRGRLLPDQERRMLALVRSANDSSHDIAIYNSRAHGYLPKTPIQKDKVLELLAPIWEKRFPRSLFPTESNKKMSAASSSLPMKPNNNRFEREAVDQEHLAGFYSDIQIPLDEIEEICAGDDFTLNERWPHTRDKLLLLKGDLMTLANNPCASAAVGIIESIMGPSAPPNFRKVWAAIRTLCAALD